MLLVKLSFINQYLERLVIACHEYSVSINMEDIYSFDPNKMNPTLFVILHIQKWVNMTIQIIVSKWHHIAL